jgi:hypothetical protein
MLFAFHAFCFFHSSFSIFFTFHLVPAKHIKKLPSTGIHGSLAVVSTGSLGSFFSYMVQQQFFIPVPITPPASSSIIIVGMLWLTRTTWYLVDYPQPLHFSSGFSSPQTITSSDFWLITKLSLS